MASKISSKKLTLRFKKSFTKLSCKPRQSFSLGLSFGLPTHDGNPSFEWIGRQSPDEVPNLKITFPDGGEDDVAILEHFNPIPVGPQERSEGVDNCIFHGYLRHEKDVYVTVTGCPNSNNLQVLLHFKQMIIETKSICGGGLVGCVVCQILRY